MRKSTKLNLTAIALTCSMASASGLAAQLDISLTNATKGIHFTPLLVAAHDGSTFLFRAGTSASAELESMAEGGDISGLSSAVTNAGGIVVENPASGPLAPATGTNFSIDTGEMGYLSLTAMLLPTNDGFVGLDSWPIPSEPGTYHIKLNGYDAGTEANDELSTSIPNPPFLTFGANGTGVETTVSNNTVHVHPGNIGDGDANGGRSDVDFSVHRWLNPVAVMTVVVN
ncbi:hypothetical protein D515_04221 [Grimontia indica]|uniref:Spondin domain-containing protein n=1 Tax=Grimontia indica TaxID=1056512 RepID=R1J123_9GAMM|nr:spondin domain-containing protein [Grimontia indica]EOD81320.1 hypothetical protein D515_04221 [Grimontia indica]